VSSASSTTTADRWPAHAIAQLYFTASGISYDPHDTAKQQEVVAQQFAGLGWQVPRLLAGGQAFLAPLTWKKIRQRNRFFKMLPYLPVSGLISRAATRTATAITIPNYGPVS